jgi:GT2 family glycosyltransferase
MSPVDSGTGESGEQVIEEFRRFHDEHYGAFSTLLRADFDKARDQFLDGSVDLLHLAGLTTHEELWRHFESWMPKLSARSVVLVHNTNERCNSGTWRAWSGLCAKYPHFEFLRGRGLGVLAVGSQVPKVLADLCILTDPSRIALVRSRFGAIGDRWERASREKALAGELAQQIASSALGADRLRQEARFWKSKAVEIQRARQQIALRLDTARKDVYAANLRADRADQAVALAQGQPEIARAEQEHLIREREDALSRAWRITSPIRWVRVRSRKQRRSIARVGQLIWSTVTLQLVSRYPKRRHLGARIVVQSTIHSPVGSPLSEVSVSHEAESAASLDTAAAQVGTPRAGDTEVEPAVIASARTELLAFLASDERLTFAPVGTPEVSVIVVGRDQAHVTFRCLGALHNQRGALQEIILMYDADSDETPDLLHRIDGIRAIGISNHTSFLHACNQGAAVARGRLLLYLSDGAAVRPGALAAALATIDATPKIGAVGGRIIQPSGKLREAGGIIWSDGGLAAYGCGLDPDATEAMFRREVDYCSYEFLMTARVAWELLGGFDESFAPSYYGDADFCMRLHKAGYRVVYEPRIVIDHCVADPQANVGNVKSALRQNRNIFRLRHGEALRSFHLPSAEVNVLSAREYRVVGRQHLLMIDAEVPFGSLGAGYPRAKEILAVASTLGWSVTLFPLHRADFDWEAARTEIASEIEIIARRGTAGLRDFLLERQGYYDVILVSRPESMELVRETVRNYPHALEGARIIYDAEAVFAKREIARAALEGRPYSKQEAEALCQVEIGLADGVDGITCVTDTEAKLFRDRTEAPVYVISHSVASRSETPSFAARNGFLFIGRLLEHAAPNWVGLRWFIHECWPLIRAFLPGATLVVVGHLHPDHADLKAPGVRLVGPAPDLSPYYDAAKVFVAPIRFAAGVPIKIIEATAAGLPTAATRLMARQLVWSPGREIIAEDDANLLASASVALHEDPAAWEAMRSSARLRLDREYSPRVFREGLEAVLTGLPPPRLGKYEVLAADQVSTDAL